MRTRTVASDIGGAYGSRFNSALRGMQRVVPSGPVPSFSVEFAGANKLSLAFSFSRASNATQFDSLGRLVWAPANFVRDTVFANVAPQTLAATGAVTLGQFSWLPPGTATTIVREIVAKGTLPDGTPYIDVRLSGTNNTASTIFPHLVFLTSATSIGLFQAGQQVGYSQLIQVIAGNNTGMSSSGRAMFQYLNSTGYIGQANTYPAGIDPDSVLKRMIVFGTPIATTDRTNAGVELSVMAGATVNITLRIAAPQCEYWSANSPQAYNANTSTTNPFYGPRFDYNPATLVSLGLLIEEARTNLIPVSGNSGASVAGNVFPTNWIVNLPTGVTATVTAVGTDAGVDYVDIRIQGVALAAGSVQIRSQGTSFTTADSFAVTASAAYAASVFASLSAGTLTNISSVQLLVQQVTADGSTFVANGVQTAYTLPSSGTLAVNRSSFSFTSAATAARARTYFIVTITEAGALDLTVRIGGFQTELGGFPTSVIHTFGAAATRTAESCYVPISGQIANGVGTLNVNYICRAVTVGLFQNIVALSQSSFDRITLYEFGTTTSGEIRAANVASATPTVTAPGAFVQRKAALGYQVSSANYAVNGTLSTLSTAAVPPTGITNLVIAGLLPNGSGGQTWTQKITYYPTRLTDAQLQALTA